MLRNQQVQIIIKGRSATQKDWKLLPQGRVYEMFSLEHYSKTSADVGRESIGLLRRPKNWKGSPTNKNQNKFYKYHGDYGHNTKEYWELLD